MAFSASLIVFFAAIALIGAMAGFLVVLCFNQS